MCWNPSPSPEAGRRGGVGGDEVEEGGGGGDQVDQCGAGAVVSASVELLSELGSINYQFIFTTQTSPRRFRIILHFSESLSSFLGNNVPDCRQETIQVQAETFLSCGNFQRNCCNVSCWCRGGLI